MKTTIEEELRRGGRLVYTNTGDSMRPMLRPHRDLMIVERPKGRLERYDVALYRRDDGQYVLHRVLRAREDGYVFCGDHSWRLEPGITDRQVLGVLTAFVRDGAEIPVTNRRYRAYVHLWCDFFPVRAAILRVKARLRGLRKRGRTAHGSNGAQ